MGRNHSRASEMTSDSASTESNLPLWATRLISLGLLFHLTAIVAGVLAAPPASDLQRGVADLFAPYYGWIDQGYSYRYYSPAPPPTPVIKAIVHYADGRSDETVRIPDRNLKPRLRYQRQLAITNALASELGSARHQEDGEPVTWAWAPAFARHIGRSHPGAVSVTLTLEQHLIPDPDLIAEEIARTGRSIDLDDPRFYTVPQRIGDFPCEGS